MGLKLPMVSEVAEIHRGEAQLKGGKSLASLSSKYINAYRLDSLADLISTEFPSQTIINGLVSRV